jgi:glycosyltransferase involved in cell wall biosynthesis
LPSEIKNKMMRRTPIIDVIIPAYNEEVGVVQVLLAIPKGLVREVIVCNNASTDKTAEVAAANGAMVVLQPEMGYGNACLKGMAYIAAKPNSEHPDIVVFIDADYSDHPDELPELVQPIIENKMDLVIGSRASGNLEKGAMTVPQRFGNWLATNLIRIFYKYHFTDLGPFRAVRYSQLVAMNMEDKTFGWTVEMQVKAAKMKMNATEIAVSYRRRIAGKSKVSGTIRGTILAGYKILWTIFKLL